MAFDPTDAVPVETPDSATPGFAFDTTDAKEVRQVGTVEAALRTAASATKKVVRTFDMAAAGLAGIFGDTEGQEEIFRDAQLRQQRMGEAYDEKPDEKFGMGGKLVGGLASVPTAMLAPGVAPGINRATEVIDRGGSLPQAAKAGAVAGGVDLAMQAVPAAVGLKTAARAGAQGAGATASVLKGAGTGAAVNVPVGIAGRAANNAALPEGDEFKDLREDPLDPEALAMDAVMSLGFGAVAGKGGHAKGKAAAKAKADAAPPPFPGNLPAGPDEGSFVTPSGAPITKEMWESSSKRVRDGWMKEKPVAEQVPAGETSEISVDEAVAKASNTPDTTEVDRIVAENPDSPAARVALEERAKILKDSVAAEQKAKDRADANALRKVAEGTTGEPLKARLLKEADKLDPPTKAKIPAGEVKEGQPEIKTDTPKSIPTGKVIEGQPEIPAGEPAAPIDGVTVRELPAEGVNFADPEPEAVPVAKARDWSNEGRPTESTASTSLKGLEVTEAETVPVGEVKEGMPDVPVEPRAPLKGVEAIEGEPIPVGEVVEDIPVGKAEPYPEGGTYVPPDDAAAMRDADTPIPVGETQTSWPHSAQEKRAPKATGKGGKGGKKVDRSKPENLDLDFPRIDEGFMREQTRARVRGPEQRAAVQQDERGRRHTRAELEKAAAEGRLDKDGVALATWALDKNPNLAADLKVAVLDDPSRPNARGAYNSADRVVKLFQGRDSPLTAAHEILHHSERMMPQKVQDGIRREWRRHLAAEMKKATPIQRQVLADIPRAINGDAQARARIMKAFEGGVLNRNKHYPLYDPSEFWAENATRILSQRHGGRNSWTREAVQWLREMIEHVKNTVGLRSDSPVIKALNDILDAQQTTGRRRSEGMLSHTDVSDMLDLAPAKGKPVLPEETKGDVRKRKLFDSQRRTEQAQDATGITDEDADMRLAARLNLGNIQKRTEDFETKVKKPLEKALADAKGAGITVRDADDYLIALHAPERNAVIRQRDPKNDAGSGYTDQQAKDIIDSFTPEQKKHLDKIAGMVHKLNRDKLDAMVDDGLITAETRDNLNAQFKKYVPLKTLEEEANFTGAGRGYQTWANDIVSATGRTSRAGSPIAASIMDATRGITRGERAKVNKVIWNFANHADSGDIVKAYDPKNPPPEVMKAELDSKGQKHMVVDQGKLADYTIPLVVDGHQQRVFVKDPALKEALATAGTPQQMNDIMRAISKATRAFTRTLTEWNVAFAPANAVRDLGTAAIRAKRLGIDATAFLPHKVARAQADVIRHLAGKRDGGAAEYEEMLNAGGKTGGYGLTSLADTMADLEKMGADLGYDDHKGGVGRKIGKVAGHVGNALSKYNEVFEYSTRLAAYKAAREKGMTPKRAAEVARKITVDFNVSGDIGRQMGHLYAFANAALQGLHGDVKDLKSPKTRYRMLSLVALGGAVQAYNEMFGGENEETGDKNVDSQSDSSLDSNVTLLNPGGREGAKIPLPPGVATGLYTLGRRLWRLGSEGNVEREATGVLGAMVESAAPVRFADGASKITGVLQGLTPALARPWTDVAVNSSQFGVPIVPKQRNERAPDPSYTLARKSTSEIAKSASKFINDATGGDEIRPGAAQKYLGNFVSPEALEYLVGYYTGGVGQLALQSKNIAKNAAEDKPQDINKIPVVRRFAFKEPDSYTSRRFHELQQDFETAKKYEKAEKSEKISPAVQATLGDYQVADKELTALFKSLREASTDADREPIQKQIKEVQASVIKAYNRARNEQRARE